MLDALRVQASSHFGLRGDGNDRCVERIGQFFGVGLDQPRPGGKTGAQGQAAAVQRYFQTEVLEHHQQFVQPLRRDTTRQAASNHDNIET